MVVQARHWVLVANGELGAPPGRLFDVMASAECLVAVDGGLQHCVELDLWPSILLGDLDSAPADLVSQAEERGVDVRRFPTDKDATDLELALHVALESGATNVTVLAAFGGRLDHELATISLLASPRWRSTSVVATNGSRSLWVVHDTCTLHLDVGSTVSLLPWHGPADGVTTQGLQWPLTDATLAAGSTHGVSNVAVEPTQHVAVGDGVLLVVTDQDGPRAPAR